MKSNYETMGPEEFKLLNKAEREEFRRYHNAAYWRAQQIGGLLVLFVFVPLFYLMMVWITT